MAVTFYRRHSGLYSLSAVFYNERSRLVMRQLLKSFSFINCNMRIAVFDFLTDSHLPTYWHRYESYPPFSAYIRKMRTYHTPFIFAHSRFENHALWYVSHFFWRSATVSYPYRYPRCNSAFHQTCRQTENRTLCIIHLTSWCL